MTGCIVPSALSPHLVQAAHEEVTLVHTALDCPERVLHDAFPLLHLLGFSTNPLLLRFQQFFIHATGDAAALLVPGTPGLDFAHGTCFAGIVPNISTRLARAAIRHDNPLVRQHRLLAL